nr:MAG TPA: hypothetical protein [Caudoviricetes sp.]
MFVHDVARLTSSAYLVSGLKNQDCKFRPTILCN